MPRTARVTAGRRNNMCFIVGLLIGLTAGYVVGAGKFGSIVAWAKDRFSKK